MSQQYSCDVKNEKICVILYEICPSNSIAIELELLYASESTKSINSFCLVLHSNKELRG